MPLNVRSSYEELQNQLEELRDQEYYYVGEQVFSGSHGEWDKVNVDAFHLWDIHHGDELNRIVMLFADRSASKAVTLVIEGRRVYRSESASGRCQSVMHSGNIVWESSTSRPSRWKGCWK